MAENKELQSLTTPNGVYNSFPDKTARNRLAGKLDAPGSVKPGDYLRVQSIGAGGTVVLEGAEPPGEDSGQNPTGGLTAEQVNALDGILKVNAYNQNSGYAAAYAAFCKAFGLTAPEGGGSGGDDSGGGEETGGSTESAWADGVAYEWENVAGEYVDATDGSFVTYSGWSRTPYMACSGAAVLRAEVIEQSVSMSRSNSSYNAFYDAERRFISAFTSVDTDSPVVGTYTDIAVPANAAFFVVSHKDNVMGATSSGIPYIRFIPYREVPV